MDKGAGRGESLVMEEIDRSRTGTTLVMPSIKCHKQQRAHDNARLHDARRVKVSSNNKCYIYLYSKMEIFNKAFLLYHQFYLTSKIYEQNS